MSDSEAQLTEHRDGSEEMLLLLPFERYGMITNVQLQLSAFHAQVNNAAGVNAIRKQALEATNPIST